MADVIPISGQGPPRVSDPLIIDPKAPLDTARQFVEWRYTHDDMRTLQHQQGVFTAWQTTHYRDFLIEETRARIYRFLEKSSVWVPDKKNPDHPILKPFKPSQRHVSDTLDALRAVCQLNGQIRQPCWLRDDQRIPATELIACQNGLLHLVSGDIHPHTPLFWSNTSLPYAYNPKAPEPVNWIAFLGSIWGEDIEAISTLQDIFGYLLGSDTDQQKIPLIVGPKRSGKGTIGRVLTGMIGHDAIVSPTLGSLQNQFGIAPLIGKSVALISDARLGGRADQQAIAERLLSISGEDLQTVDRKHVDSWSGRLSTRFFIMTNELPRIMDSSGALASRFLLLTMTESFLGKEDHNLTNDLLQELPGILNWSIEGWRRLRKRKYFLQPASSTEAMQELEDLGSPISAFLRDRCAIDAALSTDVDEMYENWIGWSKAQGRDHSGTKQTFGRDLRAALPWLTTRQPSKEGVRTREYQGIGLKVVEKILWKRDDDPFGIR